MEELQLALTAMRVEQKNFGLWLKSWQVGQMLQALVVDKSPAGNLVLRVGGHQITATADIPVQKGATLMLEVTGLHPVPTLKVTANPLAGAGARSDLLSGQLQLLMPRQGSVAAPLTALLDPVQGAKILSLLGLQYDVLSRLERSLRTLPQLAEPRVIKSALQQSGFFLESQLRQLALSGGVLPEGDIKAELLKLIDKVNRRLSRFRDEEDSGDIDTLLFLRDALEGGVATISLQQIASFQQREQGSYYWVFEIPVLQDGKADTISVEIEREAGAGQREPESQDWKVLLSLSTGQLGALQAELFLRGDKLSVVAYAEQAHTAQLLEDQLGALRNALESRGLLVSTLRSQQGLKQKTEADLDARAASYACVDQHV